MDINWADLIVNGGFAALTWYLIAKYIPSLQSQFSKDLTESRKLFKDEIKAQREECRNEVKTIREIYENKDVT